MLILGAASAGQGHEVRIEAIRFFYFVNSDPRDRSPDTVDHPVNPHTATLEELEIWSVGGGTNADIVLMIAIIRNQTRKTLTKCKVNVEVIWKFGPFSEWEKVTKKRVDIHKITIEKILPRNRTVVCFPLFIGHEIRRLWRGHWVWAVTTKVSVMNQTTSRTLEFNKLLIRRLVHCF